MQARRVLYKKPWNENGPEKHHVFPDHFIIKVQLYLITYLQSFDEVQFAEYRRCGSSLRQPVSQDEQLQ